MDGNYIEQMINQGLLSGLDSMPGPLHINPKRWAIIGIIREGVRGTFHDRIGLQNLLFNPRMLAADGCKELQDQLGALRLSSSGFSTKRTPRV